MPHLMTVALVLALMTAPPAHAQTHRAAPAPAGGGDLTLSKLVTIAACALIGGSLFYLVAEGLFADTLVADTAADATGVVGLADGAPVLVATDLAEHSGIITGMTLVGGSSNAIVGGIGYDRYHSKVEQVWSDFAGGVQAVVQSGSALLAWAGHGFPAGPGRQAQTSPQPPLPDLFPGGGV